jgi:PKD repeat protein
VVLLWASAPLVAQTFVVAPTADTYLRSGSPNRNQGTDEILRVRASGNNRALLRVPVSDISQAVGEGRLVSATLQVFIHSNADNWGTTGRTVDAHRLLASWTELGATWHCGIDTDPGNSRPDCDSEWEGGAFAEEPSDTALITDGLTGWVDFDVTEDIRDFLAGEADDGWILKKTEENQNGRVDFSSREGAAGEQPKLVLLVETADHDIVPPTLSIVAPEEPVLINVTHPTIGVSFSDGGSGVDLGSLVVTVDGAPVAGCSTRPDGATCPSPSLAAGTHAVHASLRDLTGNEAQADLSFQLLVGPGLSTVSFEAVADSYLRQGAPNQNQGNEPTLRIQGSGHNRALVRFDEQAIEAVAAGATLHAATLELEIADNGDNWGASGRTVEAHRLTSDWSEGAVTWNCSEDADPGNQAPDCAAQWDGGSFEAAPSASVLHTKGLRGRVSYDVTADVAAFLAGTPNYGWLLKKTDEGAAGRVEYASREEAPEDRPKLVVVFDVPAGGDTTPPVVALVEPAEPRIVNVTRPHIVASFTDEGSGVDPASVELVVDGVDRTGEATVSASGVELTPAEELGEGTHEVEIALSDAAGNAAQASWSILIDTQSPTVTFERPDPVLLSTSPTIPIQVRLGDGLSGVDLGTLSLSIDGQDLDDSCAFDELSDGFEVTCTSAELASGQHLLAAAVRDRATNLASAQLVVQLTVDLTAPTVTIASPVDGALVNTPTAVVDGTVSDDGPVSSLTLDGQPVQLQPDGSFSAPVSLLEGSNVVVAVATDDTGKQGTASITLNLDSTPPRLEMTAPAQSQLVNQSTVRVEGSATDESGVAQVEVNGSTVALSGSQFVEDTPVAEGDNAIVVRATDAAGNVAEETIHVVGFSLPDVEITDPQPLAYLAATTVDVIGTVSPPDAAVSVNGVVAEVAGGTFVAHDVPLTEGGSVLTATVTDAAGHESTDSFNVVRDLTPPHVQVYLPADGSTVYEDTVAVSGLVNDIVPGTVNAGQVAVSVNGVAAEVSNRSFLLPSLALTAGDNVLAVTATDVGGNTGHAEVTVHRATAAAPRVAIVSGDRQAGVIGTRLPDPLTVELLDAAGAPVAGQPVHFALERSSGSLDDGRRQVVVMTGSDGMASVQFTLGHRAGVGAQTVVAESAGFAGPAVFSATALPGDPALVVVDSGGEQIGLAGRPLPRPLIAAVTDSGFNRLAGVPVRFSVVKGAGTLDGGVAEELVTTDTDGRAIVQLTLGPDEGVSNNVVEARVDGLQDGPVASWTASGMTAGDPAQTAIRGVVLDNTNQPVPGATVRIRDTSILTQTDDEGYFRIQPAPVGTFFLIVDGSTVTRPGSWPDLEIEVTTIPGREKTLPMPVYLLPIDLADGIFVSETQGGTVTLPGIPGFALEIQPGSVTFPNGSKSGVVSATMVHSDRVPMTPNFGQQPRLIVTIQPAGARFDPPARLTLPNVEGLAPGEVTDLYSFDHDLGHFVSIGPGTVTEDGARIVANPGVGIVKAGWHCGGNPASSGTAHDCPTCQKCPPGGSHCVADPGQNGDACDDKDGCTANDRCSGGSCVGDRVQVLSVDAKGDGKDSVQTHRNKDVTFTADAKQQLCPSLTYDWDFGDGATGNGQSVTHAYADPGTYTATVTAACDSCRSESKQDSVSVEVKKFEVEIEKPKKTDHFDMQADPPQMPMVMAKAKIVGLDPDPTSTTDFSWTVDLKLEAKDCPHQTKDFSHPQIQDTVTGPDYMPQFQQLNSGTLKLKAEATIDGDTDDDELEGVEIRGTNPPNSAIHDRLPHDTLRRIACQESGFRQFNAAADGGTSKCPLFSADNLGGAGIMQITNPAPTRDEVFDWRASVDRGITIFNQKVASAGNYPGRLQRRPALMMLIDNFNAQRQLQGLPPVSVVVPPFSSGDFDTNLMELERDALRGYNGWGGPSFLGIELHEYRLKIAGGALEVVANPQTGAYEAVWEEVPTSDRHSFGDPDYVNHVLAQSPTCQ